MRAYDLITPYFKQRWKIIITGLLSLMVVDLLQLIIPRVIKRVVDDLTLLDMDPAGLVRYAALMAVMALFIGLFRYIWRHCLLGTARFIEKTLRDRLVRHLHTLSAGYFDTVQTGDLMAHATNDIQQVRMATGMGLVAFNDALGLGAAAIGFMLYINVELTLYVLIPMPLIAIGTRMLSKRMHLRYQKVQAAFGDMTEIVRERCAGMRMIKAHNQEGAAARAVDDFSRAYVTENMKLVGITSVFFPLMLLFTNLSLAIVLLVGGRKAILAEMTTGDFVAFISYLNLLSWPMMALGWVTNLIQRGSASLVRLKGIIDREPDIRQPATPIALSRARGRLSFEQVTFAYGPQSKGPVLSDISITAEPGQILGLVGPPAAGKSTLLNLVPRLYDVTGGRITIDGMDVRRAALDDLRRQIAHVPQEPFIFAGTISDNLLFGCGPQPKAVLERIIEDVRLEETIAEMPNGLDTVVGEKGVMLSGGQKQRIALARALLMDAPLLLLDDPVSQVDTGTGAHIIAAIARLAGRSTVIMVSHRLAAVRTANEIISLDSGRLVERGTHQQLLEAGGYYAKAHGLQELENGL
jgi:ATP-binding cassette subfamily B protein